MVHSVDTVLTMKATSYSVGDCIIAGGYHEIGDGGGGTFVCNKLNNFGDPPNNWRYDEGLILESTFPSPSPVFYFQRLVDTPYISVKWFGAFGDGQNDDRDAICSAMCPNENNNSGYTSFQGLGLPYALGLRPTRSRIYFPAGVYLFSKPIYSPPGLSTDYGYNWRQGAQLYGEYAILKASASYPGPVSTTQPIPPLLAMGAVIDIKFSTLTFKGFPSLMYLNSYNNDSGDVMIENCNFSDIVYATDPSHPGDTQCIKLELQSSYGEIRNCHWRNCQHAVRQREGQTYINGGMMRDFNWVENNDAQVILHGTEWLQMENTVCSVPNLGFSAFAGTCNWIRSYGHFKATNVKFRPALGHSSNMHSVIRTPKGLYFATWNSPGTDNYNSYAGGQVRLADCETACEAEVVTLNFIPCRIVLQDNFGFINNASPAIKYSYFTPLKSILYDMQAMLSIKLDNIPNMPTRQPNRIYSQNDSKDQLLFLPFMRVDTGLTSYGYLEDLSGSPQPLPLRFYMGRTSFNTDLGFEGPWVKSALWADYAYTVKLYNLVENGFPSDMGKIVEYSEYRVETYIEYDAGVPQGKRVRIKDIELVAGGTNPNSPEIFKPLPLGDERIMIRSKGGGEGPFIYGIFYEITSLIPPVAIL